MRPKISYSPYNNAMRRTVIAEIRTPVERLTRPQQVILAGVLGDYDGEGDGGREKRE